jgi:hypothetical protein
MLSSRTGCVSALVASLAGMTGIAPISGIAPMSCIARVSAIACLPCVAGLSDLALLPGLALFTRLSGRSSRSLHGRCWLLWSWGLVAAPKNAQDRDQNYT